ncbi:MAG: DUF1501 domain-containing protein [Acidobacteria bacterium]|nr:DUF1501 domain-containing protein [Acidobacteriota bacterium]
MDTRTTSSAVTTHHRVYDTPYAVARRRFLQGLLTVAGTAAISPRLLVGEAFAGPSLGSRDAVLVIVTLMGGNDGLNTVAPIGDSRYRSLRGSLALNPATAHRVDKGFALHPSLRSLKARYDRGDVAFVHGVGDPVYDHSHFNAMAKWMDGRTSPNFRSGWAGRTVDRMGLDLISGVSVGYSGTPLHMKGQTIDTIGLPPSGSLWGASRKDPHVTNNINAAKGFAQINHGKGQLGNVVADSMADMVKVAGRLAPASRTNGDDDLAAQLRLCARLINLDVGSRILNVELGSFDTHDFQAKPHAELLAELDAGIEAFFQRLDPGLANRVTLMTFSEFGRRGEANGSSGTDHGSASTMIVAGRQVKGGHYGPRPNLAKLTARGDVPVAIDYRRYYSTFIERWFGLSSAAILGRHFAPLDILHRPGVKTGKPSQRRALIPPPGTLFAPLVPARLLDTREGVPSPYGPQTTHNLKVTGVGGVPANAGAVVCNVTSTQASARSYLTVWPAGAPKPHASNVNTIPGDDVPNLVIAKVGANGQISIYNHAGTGHVIVDVMGWLPGW